MHVNLSTQSCVHPNILKLLDALIEIQCDVYAKMFGVHRFQRRKAAVTMENDVSAIMTQRETEELTRYSSLLLDFFGTVCFLTKLLTTNFLTKQSSTLWMEDVVS